MAIPKVSFNGMPHLFDSRKIRICLHIIESYNESFFNISHRLYLSDKLKTSHNLNSTEVELE